MVTFLPVNDRVVLPFYAALQKYVNAIHPIHSMFRHHICRTTSISPVLGAVFMSPSTVIVAINAQLLKRKKHPGQYPALDPFRENDI